MAPLRFTAYEIARVLAVLQVLAPPREPAERIRHGLAWSLWRRTHQAIALICHRRTRDRKNPGNATDHNERPPPQQPQPAA